MVVRRKKKSEGKRGNRTHHGNKKNWRGGGSRGGKGNAGSQKHKRNLYYHMFGTKKRQPRHSEVLKTINLGAIDQLLPRWQADKKVTKNAAGAFVIDGNKVGVQKILGRGDTQHELVFENIVLTKKAQEKMEGTEFESTGESA